MVQWCDTSRRRGGPPQHFSLALPDAKSREFLYCWGRTGQPQSRRPARTFLLELCLTVKPVGVRQDVPLWQLHHGGPDNQLTPPLQRRVLAYPITPLRIRSGTSKFSGKGAISLVQSSSSCAWQVCPAVHSEARLSMIVQRLWMPEVIGTRDGRCLTPAEFCFFVLPAAQLPTSQHPQEPWGGV